MFKIYKKLYSSIFRKRIFLRINREIVKIRIKNSGKHVTSLTEARILSARMNSVMVPVEKLPEIPLRAANDGTGSPHAIRPDENPSVRTKSFPKCSAFEGERPLALSHENTCNLQGWEKFDYLSPSSLMHFCNLSFLHFALLVISRRMTTLLFAVILRFRWGCV